MNFTIRQIQILKFLNKTGSGSVEQVLDYLNTKKDANIEYTGALKLLQILYDEEKVDRIKNQRKHIYISRINDNDLLNYYNSL